MRSVKRPRLNEIFVLPGSYSVYTIFSAAGQACDYLNSRPEIVMYFGVVSWKAGISKITENY